MARKTEAPDTPEPGGGTDMWSGLEEWANTPEFHDMLHREFPEDATAWTDPVSRRAFLTIAGATAALAGAGCSPRPASREKIYPYVRQPEQMTPGLPLFFATGFTLNGITTGVLAKSREGRPIKLEGNPTHPGASWHRRITQSTARVCTTWIDRADLKNVTTVLGGVAGGSSNGSGPSRTQDRSILTDGCFPRLGPDRRVPAPTRPPGAVRATNCDNVPGEARVWGVRQHHLRLTKFLRVVS